MSLHPRPSMVLLDPVGGVSGDMFVAALLNTWPILTEPVFSAVYASGLPPGTHIGLAESRNGDFATARLRLEVPNPVPSGAYTEVRQRVLAAAIPDAVRGHALEMLRLLAEAEAVVHRVPVEHVHFHELADWDTQAELVAAATLIETLHGTRWYYRPLPLGRGTVDTAHGMLPIPAPAVLALLEGFTFDLNDGILAERITPTGAAILRYLGPQPATHAFPGRLIASGTGAGSRSLPGLPNVLRVLGFVLERSEFRHDSVLVIEFDIDDQSPEELAAGIDRLRRVPGVLDVLTIQGIGKKGRWVQVVRVLACPDARTAVLTTVFEQTTTLGARIHEEARVVLPRQTVVVDDLSGPVRVKVVDRPHGRSAKAEADDVAERAATAEERARLRRTSTERALHGQASPSPSPGSGQGSQ
jgi:pyridinium-3,5-bisthiocarboxylic acid mononucleotide nickel chelatase